MNQMKMNDYVWVRNLVIKHLLPPGWRPGKSRITYELLLYILEVIEKHSLILSKSLTRSLTLLHGKDVSKLIKEAELFRYNTLMLLKNNPVRLIDGLHLLYSSEKKDGCFVLGPFCDNLGISRNLIQRIITTSEYNDVKELNNGSVLELDQEREKMGISFSKFCILLNLLSSSLLGEGWIKKRLQQAKKKKAECCKKLTVSDVRTSNLYFNAPFGGPELRYNIDAELNVNDAIIMTLYQEQQKKNIRDLT